MKKLLNVGNNSWYDREVEMAVSMFIDDETSFSDLVPNILHNGVRVLVYSGEYDFAANYVGGERWTNQLNWNGHDAFNNATLVPWNVNGVLSGWIKSVEGLTFLKVKDAGHLVPMNTPISSLFMFQTFIQNKNI